MCDNHVVRSGIEASNEGALRRAGGQCSWYWATVVASGSVGMEVVVRCSYYTCAAGDEWTLSIGQLK